MYIINRLPSIILSNLSPFEILFSTKLGYYQLKVFGILCYPHLIPYNDHKIQPKSTLCTFLGYSPRHKGYKYLSKDDKLYNNHDVIFDEHQFPLSITSFTLSVNNQMTPTKQLYLPFLHPKYTHILSHYLFNLIHS